MKRFFILLALLFFAVISCTKDEKYSFLEEEEKGGITLNLICSEPTTKSDDEPDTKPGEDPYNENRIYTIDYYFYPLDGTNVANVNSVLHGREGVNRLGEATINIPIDANKVNTQLFPGTNEYCYVAVIINYPSQKHPVYDDGSENGSTKLADIRKLPLETDFRNSENSPIQPQFVMFGEFSEVKLEGRKKKVVAKPTVKVKRVASKITLDLQLPTSVTVDREITYDGHTFTIQQEWEPVLVDSQGNNMLWIYLQNAMKKAVLSGDFSALTGVDETFFIKYGKKEFKEVPGSPNNKASYPFYTYPQTWQPNYPYEPFLKIELSWMLKPGEKEYAEGKYYKWGQGSPIKNYYYRVILPNVSKGFESNYWYHIIMEIGTLGSETDDAGVLIEGKYYVKDWTGQNKTSVVNDPRYLSVPEIKYEMFNTTELSIPYISSHTCGKAVISATYKNFKTHQDEDVPNPDSYFRLDSDNNLIFEHPLNNDINSPDFDAAPYYFTVKLYHSDYPAAAALYKEIKIIQYPAMYIEEAQSNHYVFVKNKNNTSDAYDYYYWGATTTGLIWDDNGTPTRVNTNNVKGEIGSLVHYSLVTGSGDNNNQYQYTIYVKVLPEGSPYSIGDPRTSSGQTLDRLNDLSDYRPAADNTQDIIAPVFKIASSYGKTQQMTYEGGVKRCAAYQENGYPQGRWRLPTKAEIEYLVNLSQKNKIPTLFGSESTTGYWAGGRSFYVAYLQGFKNLGQSQNPSGVNRSNVPYYSIDGINYNVYTRCVYDVWYWGNDIEDNRWLTNVSGYQTTRD